ncbi:MAG: MFS transporter [Actinomycetota bacterium]
MTLTGSADTATRRPPYLGRRLPSRVHYAWWITFGTAVLMFVGVGVGYYGLAVFLRPLRDEHGWSNAVVSGATGMYFSISGVTAAVVGPIVDRRGPLRLMLTGAGLMAVAISAVGVLDQIWQLYAVYAVLAVSFGLTTGTGVQSILSRWFVTRRAEAISISATGVSVGGMVLVPVGAALIDQGGIELAAPVMGALVLAVAVPIITGVLVWDPRELGVGADADRPLVTDNASLREDVQRRVWTRSEAARTRAFWTILIGFVLVLAAQTGFLIHQLSFLEERFDSRQVASFTLTLTAFGSVVARLVVGRFADRVPKVPLTVACCVVQAIAVFGVALVDTTWTTWIFVLVVGFTIGNIYMLQSLLVSELFGFVSFATVMGVISLATQTGSGAGPFLVGWMESTTGSYTAPFVASASATLLAAAIIAATRPPD